jgi:hypothetical protein
VTPRSPLTPCGRGRCKRNTYTVKIMKARGAPVAEEIDAEPSTWVDGARIKLLPSDHLPDGEQLAERLTQAQMGRAFAVKHLYVPHADRCSAQKKKTGRTKQERSTHG